MGDDPYSLSNLRDIAIPDVPAFWPPAPGLWLALGTVVLTLFLVAWQWRAVRKRNVYRKAGLLLLSEAKTAHDVSIVMKRVALAAFPRERVASLYGKDWAAFLQETCPRMSFLELAATDENEDSARNLVPLASAWIRHHRVTDVRDRAEVA